MDNYWKVVVYYDIDYDLYDIIAQELEGIDCSTEEIGNIFINLLTEAKAFTFSNIHKRVSVVGFNEHSNKYDYINSIVHEAEHVKQAMLYYYDVEDAGEPPAYTVGYLVSEMISMNKRLCLV